MDKVYEAGEVGPSEVSSSNSGESDTMHSEDEDVLHARLAPVPKSARAKKNATTPNNKRRSSLVFEDETARHSLPPSSSNGGVGGSSAKKRQVRPAEVAAACPRRVSGPLPPADEQGQPCVPFTVGVVTVHSLGQVVWDKPAFHNKRYIWPLGYHTSRAYLSGVNPEAQTIYHSEIVEAGNAPQFVVWAEDQPEVIHRSPTSTGAWTAVLKQAHAIRGKEYGNSASGPDFVGLTHATICMFIEQLPNADRCAEYQMKTWEIVDNDNNIPDESNIMDPVSDLQPPSSNEVANTLMQLK